MLKLLTAETSLIPYCLVQKRVILEWWKVYNY